MSLNRFQLRNQNEDVSILSLVHFVRNAEIVFLITRILHQDKNYVVQLNVHLQ